MFLINHLAQSTPRPFWSTSTLIASCVSSVLSKATRMTPAALARLMTGPKAVGFCAVDDDGVIAGVDEIVDRRNLRRHVLAGGDDLEFLELGRDSRLRRISFGRLDHLNAPGVGDIAVRERNAERTFLGGVFEELGVGGPRREALGIGGWPLDDFRTRGASGRAERESAAAKMAPTPAKRQSCALVVISFLPAAIDALFRRAPVFRVCPAGADRPDSLLV